jgi:hypothetical protein
LDIAFDLASGFFRGGDNGFQYSGSHYFITEWVLSNNAAPSTASASGLEYKKRSQRSGIQKTFVDSLSGQTF